MSIGPDFLFLAATATDVPAEATTGQMLVSATLVTLAGLALAVPAGVFRRRSVVGPARLLADDESRALARGVAMVAVSGMAVWFLSQILLVGHATTGLSPGQRASGDVSALISPAQFAVLATAPALAGLFVLVVGDLMFGRVVVEKLGYLPSRLPGGLVAGTIGIIVVLPLIYACSIVMQLVYTLIGYEHPAAHELLLKLNDTGSDPLARYGLIFGAVLCAPVFEEFLFRGHLQSILLAFFQKFVPTAPAPPAWPRWAAIFATALLFTVVHAAWTAPPIFLLAVALGYVYERTGNLWAAIVVHALFNGLSTWVYVNSAM
jgi:membrane protease YdiL (CAAX protease family)